MSETTENFTNNKTNTTKENIRKNAKEIHSHSIHEDKEHIQRILDQELTHQENRDHWGLEPHL